MEQITLNSEPLDLPVFDMSESMLGPDPDAEKPEDTNISAKRELSMRKTVQDMESKTIRDELQNQKMRLDIENKELTRRSKQIVVTKKEKSNSHLNTTMETRLLKNAYIRKIKQSIAAFPECLSSLKMKSYDKLNIDELKIMVEECRMSISSYNSDSNINSMVFGGMTLAENLLNTITKGKVNLASPMSLSGVLSNNSVFINNMKQLQLEHDFSLFSDKPEYRMLMSVVMAGATVHNANSMANPQPQVKSKNIDKKEKNIDLSEYSDL